MGCDLEPGASCSVAELDLVSGGVANREMQAAGMFAATLFVPILGLVVLTNVTAGDYVASKM
jgi:hypothetical protein